ncbi:MAG TPA: DUF5946 family protein [Candidatus Limnocylindrales bacterium]|nr:DUF5946 family protein [Candidatus Limnocylindrales bacterium]
MSKTVPMGRCPGCGVELPGSAEPWDPRSLASEACHALYGEVAGFESQRIVELGRWHQLLVDAYAAQHAGERTPPMGAAFALIGLHLALEQGWDGLEVRNAHQDLARRYREWPAFPAPERRGALTVLDLALASTPEEHVERLRAWATTVWQAWAGAHPAVEVLIAERLPLDRRLPAEPP